MTSSLKFYAGEIFDNYNYAKYDWINSIELMQLGIEILKMTDFNLFVSSKNIIIT